MIKKYDGYGNYIIRWNPKLFDKEQLYKEEWIAILENGVWKLRIGVIPCVKLQYRNYTIDEYMGDKNRHVQMVSTLVHWFRYILF